ncbi:hypothetical protein Tco_1077741 [Tanacetum coccineum]
MNRVPRWGQVSSPASFRKHGKEESSSNNPSKQKACQQSVEPTVKRKGAKDAIKALTSKLQSMSPRAFMRKQAKAHVNTPTCARQLMCSSTYGTCDIEDRDINNSCNATPVLVLHTSHGVNTSPSDVTRDKNRGISGSSYLLMNRVPRWGQVSSPASFRKHGKEESSSNIPSKQKACQQSVEPTVKCKGAKDAIKALTSKLMYSSTHGTCDIEARDINNSCNATHVQVLHSSHGVNTSPSDDTGDKNIRISGSSSLLMNRVPRWGQVSCPASFRKYGIKESSFNNPSKQKACQQSVEPTVKRKGAKDAIKALTSKLQSMSPRAFMRNTQTLMSIPQMCWQLMYSYNTRGFPSDDTKDKNRGISGSSSLLMNRVPRWGQVSCPASFRRHGIEESSSNNPNKQKACQQSFEPTVKRKGAKDAIKALTSKLQSMSPRAFMQKQAKAHVDTLTCARQLMYSSTHETCDIEARDINNSCNATLVPVLHTSHGVNTSPSDVQWIKTKNGIEESSFNNPSKQKACQQSVEPTVKVGAEGVINGLDIKGRTFMRKQAKAHVNTPTCARQLMYSSTHGTYDIEARDINNLGNATPVPVLHTSHGVNTSPSDELVVRSTLTEHVKQIQEWMEQYRPVRNSFGKERQRGGGKITNKKYTNITMLMAT